MATVKNKIILNLPEPQSQRSGVRLLTRNQLLAAFNSGLFEFISRNETIETDVEGETEVITRYLEEWFWEVTIINRWVGLGVATIGGFNTCNVLFSDPYRGFRVMIPEE